MNKTLAKSAATPAKKVPAKVEPVKAAAAPPATKVAQKPEAAPAPARRPAGRASRIPEPAPAPITNRFTDRFAPARAPLRNHDEPDVYKPLAKPDPKLANAWKTKAARDISEAELLAMPDSEYMNEKQREFFRLRLQAQKDDLLSNAGETTEHLREDTSIVPDPADRATIEEEHALELRTRDRERKLLSKIDQALERVAEGSYGYCEDTGEPISIRRLEARPIATLSLEAQERHERLERTQREE